MKYIMGLALVAALATAAQAQETMVWWDFLGDGLRMKQLIDEFNAAHEG